MICPSIETEVTVMNNIEEIIKQAYKKLKERKIAPVGNCLSDEEMSCFIDNVLDKQEKGKFLAHIISCNKCAQNLKDHYSIIKAVKNKGVLETPEQLVREIEDLVYGETRQNVLDIVLEFKEKAIQIIKTTGEIIQESLGPQPAPAYAFRAPQKETEGKEIRVSKEFNNLVVDVEIERQKPELANIIVRLTDKTSKKRATGFRVSLIKGDRELESSLIEEGKVKFEEIKLNDYKIYLMKDNKQIGVINISIKASK